ncbi:MAG: AraC family transcriptional regulator [Ruminococcaceae bacterium]|nr:AraC family transcriptional regulator [Oscillospiraceae bacterium]
MSEYTPTSFAFHHTVTVTHNNTFHRHMHNGYELLYFVSGDAEYIIEGSVYKLQMGNLLFIPPRRFHYLSPLSNAVYERYVIHFPFECVPENLRDFVISANEIYTIPKDSLAACFFKNWKTAEKSFSREDMSAYLKSALPQILLFIKYLPTEESIKPIRNDATLESILEYIDTHPEEPLTAESLSTKFYMSRSWIVHAFKKNLGISLMQYIQKKRVLYAESLICGGVTPTEAAKICKYENYSTFYRQYKKILGTSPKGTSKRA